MTAGNPPTEAEDPTFSVNSLIAVKSISPELAKRLQEADVNGDGQLSVEEILKVIKSEHTAQRQKSFFKRVMLILGISSLLLIGALCGITYGIVDATKKINVGSDNNLRDKSSGSILANGMTLTKFPVNAIYNSEDGSVASNLKKIILDNDDADGTYTVYTVQTVLTQRNKAAVIEAASGDVFIADASGLRLSTTNLTTTDGTPDYSWYENGKDHEGAYGEYYRTASPGSV